LNSLHTPRRDAAARTHYGIVAMKHRLDSVPSYWTVCHTAATLPRPNLDSPRTQREDDLLYRENELLNMLVMEQGRWIELNASLDGLERALSPNR
jgi:hypothetical protein